MDTFLVLIPLDMKCENHIEYEELLDSQFEWQTPKCCIKNR